MTDFRAFLNLTKSRKSLRTSLQRTKRTTSRRKISIQSQHSDNKIGSYIERAEKN